MSEAEGVGGKKKLKGAEQNRRTAGKRAGGREGSQPVLKKWVGRNFALTKLVVGASDESGGKQLQGGLKRG